MEKAIEKKTRKPRKPGKRSPGYPLISLEEAIQKAKILWDKDKDNYIPLAAAYEHLGYRSTGGYAARIIAALKKFELISEKQDAIKLTEEAIDLALLNPSDERYNEIIKKLALRPSTYEKIFKKYNGNLPSDNTLRIELIKGYGFNPESVEVFLSSFRETLEFAGLPEGKEIEKKEVIPAREEEKLKIGHQMQNIENSLIYKAGAQTFPIPLSKRNKAAIVFETLPLDKKDIEKIKSWLDLFSDSLTEPEN